MTLAIMMMVVMILQMMMMMTLVMMATYIIKKNSDFMLLFKAPSEAVDDLKTETLVVYAVELVVPVDVCCDLWW